MRNNKGGDYKELLEFFVIKKREESSLIEPLTNNFMISETFALVYLIGAPPPK